MVSTLLPLRILYFLPSDGSTNRTDQHTDLTVPPATVTTEHLAEGLAADYDAEGRLAGIEILDALKRFGSSQTLRQVILEDVGLLMPRLSREFDRNPNLGYNQD